MRGYKRICTPVAKLSWQGCILPRLILPRRQDRGSRPSIHTKLLLGDEPSISEQTFLAYMYIGDRLAMMILFNTYDGYALSSSTMCQYMLNCKDL